MSWKVLFKRYLHTVWWNSAEWRIWFIMNDDTTEEDVRARWIIWRMRTKRRTKCFHKLNFHIKEKREMERWRIKKLWFHFDIIAHRCSSSLLSPPVIASEIHFRFLWLWCDVMVATNIMFFVVFIRSLPYKDTRFAPSHHLRLKENVFRVQFAYTPIHSFYRHTNNVVNVFTFYHRVYDDAVMLWLLH